MQGAVSFRLDWNGLSLVYSGDTKPNMFMVENSQNVDILIHETFLPAKIFAKKTGMSDVVASNVVNAFHTPPRSAGQIFSMTEPRLGVMFHTMMDVETIRPVFDDLRITYQGPQY